MATYSNSAREVEMPDGNVVVLHSEPTGGANTTSNIKKFKYDDNGHVTESTAADAEDLNLSSYSTPTTGTTAIGTSDDVQTAIGKLDHQSHIDQTNILYALNTGAKNLLNIIRTDVPSEVKINSDGSIVINHSASSSASWVHLYDDPNSGDNGYKALPDEWKGKYFSGIVSTLYGAVLLMEFSNNGTSWAYEINVREESTKAIIPSSYAYYRIALKVDANITLTNFVIKPMIADEIVYNTVGDGQPPALPNSDLTQLEAEDRAALAEVVDSGEKNLLDLGTCTITSTYSGLTFTRNGNTLTVSCDGMQTTTHSIDIENLNLPTNKSLIISGCPSGGGMDTYLVDYFDNGGYVQGQTADTGNGSGVVTFTTMTNSKIRIRVASGASFTNKVFNLMVCTKAAFDVSTKIVPHYTRKWQYVSQSYTSQVANTMEYSGISFTVPAGQIYEFYVLDGSGATNPTGIGVCDSNTNYNSNSTIIAENMDTQSTYTSNVRLWARQVSGVTVPYDSDITYYIWVKRSTAAGSSIRLLFRRIYLA